MDRLRDVFTALEFSNVATFIASGNVIFEAPATEATGLEERIEAQLERSLGYEVDTFLRTPADLASIVAFRPFASEEVEHRAIPRMSPSFAIPSTVRTSRG